MNATATTPKNITALDFDTIVPFPRELVRKGLREIESPTLAEEELTALIWREGEGRSLLIFCRELCHGLIRDYLVEDDAGELQVKLCSSIVETIGCTENEAQCLLDLSLELIHVKVYHEYRCSNLDLNYLISMAAAAVNRILQVTRRLPGTNSPGHEYPEV